MSTAHRAVLVAPEPYEKLDSKREPMGEALKVCAGGRDREKERNTNLSSLLLANPDMSMGTYHYHFYYQYCHGKYC